MKKVLKTVVVFMLTLAMCVGTTGAAASAEASVMNSNVQSSWDGLTTENKYVGENFSVTFSLASYWEGGYNANIRVENTGSSVIENWYLSFALNNKLTTIWNAEVVSNENGQYVVKNANWNADIPVDGYAEFGISVNENFAGFPGVYKLLGENTQVQEEEYSVEYILDSDWGSGFTARVLLTNNTKETLEDWTLEFDFDREITNIWNGVIEAHEGNHYVIKNAGHNANIAMGQSLSFGFQGEGGNASDVLCTSSLYAYELYNGTSMELDTDNDGIMDGDETILGLDYKNVDSDKDGLTDYEEMYITLTDPLNRDTDGNGISDSLEDIDGDEIDNKTEIQYGTNPLLSDTDRDNVTDYEEIYVYTTDPLRVDTDQDGLNDYDDIYMGFSPLLKDTDGNGIWDSKEEIEQVKEVQFEATEGKGLIKVGVEMKVSGNIERNVNISNIYGVDVQSSNVVGLVGVPVEINSEVMFDTAEITFYYDETVLGDVKEEDLAVLWYDEDNEWYHILDLESVVDTESNKVSYVTSHFSTYMLVDSQAWYNAWRENIDYRNSEQGDAKQYFDIAFVVDVSGSMSGSYISTAKSALRDFVDSMQGGDAAALVRFESRAYTVCEFTDKTSVLKDGISSLSASGGTNVNNGLLKALELFSDREGDKQKIIVLICDGDVNYVQSTIDLCKDQNIQIYAVNVASAVAHNSLQEMAKQTGGQYYYGVNSNSIKDMLSFIQGDTVDQIDSTDTDGDGLYDIYEIAGMKTLDGRIINTDPNLPDTDGDGLSDYDETGIIYNVDERYIGFNVFKKIKYFKMKSDPTSVDTDSDSLSDNVDPYPWKPVIMCVEKLSNRFDGVEYLNIADGNGGYLDGGKQGWWKDFAKSTADYNFKDFFTDKNYRIWNMGCGLIAASDVEIYLTQQNEGYKPLLSPSYDIEFDATTGEIAKDNYMSYVDINADLIYEFGGGLVYYNAGLLPSNIERGLMFYLRANKHEQTSVKWAPYTFNGNEKEKTKILDEIESMLDKDLPVVFSYYDSSERLNLYSSANAAKEKDTGAPGNSSCKGHYMTIIGLYKYLNEDTSEYEYILKVTSWGDIYYIRYDEYSDNISYFTNIFKIS